MDETVAKKSNVLKKVKSLSKKTDLSSVMFGKLPPQARDLEDAVLGAIMIDKHAIGDVVDILKPSSFYDERNNMVYEAILELFEQSEPIDLLTVTQQLKKLGNLEAVGGPYYLTELTSRVASSANSEFHARIVVQKYIQRELIRVSSLIIEDAYEDTTDVFDLLDKAEKGIFEITNNNLRRGMQDMQQLVAKALNEISEVRESKGLIGIPSGFVELDRMTSGWQPTDLIIVAARPAMGKTSFVLNMARNAAVDHDAAVAVFSLEMGATQLAKRLITSETEIEADKIKNGRLESYEWAELNKKVEKLSQSKLFIIDTPAINIFELRAQCRRLKSAHDIKMIFIDYLQLMSGTSEGKGSGNREQEISNISRSLKSIAKELNIPVIALSQLSRAVETRGGDKRPMLSDLRESGAIEQDADMVLFLYRPDYYGFLQDEEGNSTQGIAEVIISKHRNGATGTIPLRFIKKFTKFTDVDSFSDADQYGTDAGIITKGSKMNEDRGLPSGDDYDPSPF
ncbi:MAG: replicative DNA helicase [Bacteroidetes bacterium]|nr:replicative DNA helicase [Bacteroidota bacterium]